MGLASVLADRCCADEGARRGDGLVLHSDNGGPMKGATMLATLQRRLRSDLPDHQVPTWIPPKALRLPRCGAQTGR